MTTYRSKLLCANTVIHGNVCEDVELCVQCGHTSVNMVELFHFREIQNISSGGVSEMILPCKPNQNVIILTRSSLNDIEWPWSQWTIIKISACKQYQDAFNQMKQNNTTMTSAKSLDFVIYLLVFSNAVVNDENLSKYSQLQYWLKNGCQ